MEYHELNSTFKYDVKVLKVIKSTNGCRGCYFASLDDESLNCKGFACMVDSRKDKESAMFIEQKVMEYHELNSTFEHEGKVLKVVEAVYGCAGCYFKGTTCDNFACLSDERKDQYSVIFELQGEIVVPEKTEGLNILEAARALSKGFGVRRKGTKVSIWASRDVDGKPMIASQIVAIEGIKVGIASFQTSSLLANDWEIIK